MVLGCGRIYLSGIVVIGFVIIGVFMDWGHSVMDWIEDISIFIMVITAIAVVQYWLMG